MVGVSFRLRRERKDSGCATRWRTLDAQGLVLSDA